MSDKSMSVSWIPKEGMFRIANPTEKFRRQWSDACKALGISCPELNPSTFVVETYPEDLVGILLKIAELAE